MTEDSSAAASRAVIEVFEVHLKRWLLVREGEPDTEAPLSFVLPTSFEEVELIPELATRYSV
jgi:hypothetical protein